MANVNKVEIVEDECISCEACVAEAPAVFEMNGDKAKVKAEAKSAEFLQQHSDQVSAAVDACPSSAIKVE